MKLYWRLNNISMERETTQNGFFNSPMLQFCLMYEYPQDFWDWYFLITSQAKVFLLGIRKRTRSKRNFKYFMQVLWSQVTYMGIIGTWYALRKRFGGLVLIWHQPTFYSLATMLIVGIMALRWDFSLLMASNLFLFVFVVYFYSEMVHLFK